MVMKRLISIICLISSVYGQACCSAGTPFLGSVEMTNPGTNWFNIDVIYNYNLLEDLYEGNKKLDDNSRKRIAESFLLQLNYGLNSKISISTLFSFVRQERIISNHTGTKRSTETSGIGDMLVMIKYNILSFNPIEKDELIAGFGVKLPTGNSRLKSEGILLPADLQPGTGSYDFLFNIYGSKKYIFSLPVHSYVNLSYKLNGENSRFGDDENYKFGNEFISSLGFIFELSDILTLTLEGKYRNTSRDEYLAQRLENTSGDWFYIKPAFNVFINSSLLVKFSSELPLFRNLDGTQLTTSYLFSTQLQYAVSLN